MKIYYNNFAINGTKLLNTLVDKDTLTTISKDNSSSIYRAILQEVSKGRAQIVEYVEPPQPAIVITWEYIKKRRDELLKETDWVGLKDVSLKNEIAWLNYRQALRDLPQSFPTPESVVWPIKPS
jgi:hypothetical protein